jgi:phage shock protein A
MGEFIIDYENIDVTRIMEEIKRRIEEKKKKMVYTDEELSRLARAKVASLIHSSDLKSDLAQELQRLSPDWKIFLSLDKLHASRPNLLGRMITLFRKMMHPIVKLFFNVDVLIHELNKQDLKLAHLVHNLILELTRLRLKHEELRHRVDALYRRIDFVEKRERTLEEITLNEESRNKNKENGR